MREIDVENVTQAVRDLCIKTNTCLREDQVSALQRGLEEEESELGREVIEKLLENAEISCGEGVPFCLTSISKAGRSGAEQDFNI